jgi:hypothetical protein
MKKGLRLVGVVHFVVERTDLDLLPTPDEEGIESWILVTHENRG